MDLGGTGCCFGMVDDQRGRTVLIDARYWRFADVLLGESAVIWSVNCTSVVVISSVSYILAYLYR